MHKININEEDFSVLVMFGRVFHELMTTPLKYLVFDLHIILSLIAYGPHFKIMLGFNIIGNIILWNALNANGEHLHFIISGSIKIHRIPYVL